MNGYILLTGIHGVGKSSLAKTLNEYLRLDVYTISDLIRKAGKRIDSTNKNTADVQANQLLWRKELNNIKNESGVLVLDGHFCLLDNKQSIIILPEDTFLGTSLKKIVLITLEPSIIKNRLLNRDGIDYPLELLNEFQQCEIKSAINFSRKHNIPLFRYEEGSVPISELIAFFNY